jgi:putative ABC transport system permease protein
MASDFRYALRSFRREPTFVAGVVLTCALAIGTNAAMFGLVQRLMLAPPPGIGDAERVFRAQVTVTSEDGDSFAMSTMSYPAFRTLAAVGSAFRDAAAVRSDTMTTGRGAELSQVAVMQASGTFFSVLRARPALGRFFGPADDELPSGSPVIVLSHAYWQRRFAGEASVVGRELVIDDQPFTVIGVASKDFNGADLAPVDVFMPLTTAMRNKGPGWWNEPGSRVVSVVARLRDGVSAAAAGTMVKFALRSAAAASLGDRLTTTTLESIVPGQSSRKSTQAQIALWLSGVSFVVLLIATANVGTLLLLRSARRRRESAVRRALGASQGRLVRQSLVESLILALVGGACGLVLAYWFADIVRVTLLPNLAATDHLMNATVLLASVIGACAVGILAGLGPLVHLRRQRLSAELHAGGGHGSSGRFVFQNILVTLQVALCTLLLVGAGLFVRSLQRVQSQDLGFSTARLLYARLEFRGRVPGADRDIAHEEAARQLAKLAGVSRVTVVEGMPFSSHHIPPINVPGYTFPPNVQIPIMYGATPRYLEMMGVTLREGRLIAERDALGAPLVVLVNETMARTVWPGQRAIGKCVRAGFGAGALDSDPMAAAAALPCREVVGVVKDSRARSLRLEGNEAKLMQYYVPFPQIPASPFGNEPLAHGILVRTAGEPRNLVGAVQRTIQSTSLLPVYARVRPYQDLIDPQLRSWRLGAMMFSAFGALALGIAAVGLFAVVSYLVTQRTQEIGIRVALGSSRTDVARLIVWDGVRMAAVGTTVGATLALAAAPLVQSMLFQTSAREPASMIVAVVLLLLVTVAAAALPAWRASHVSPMTALRTDA